MAKTALRLKPIKVGQKIFHEWCAHWGAVVDVEMAADLVVRIEEAIIAERIAEIEAIRRERHGENSTGPA